MEAEKKREIITCYWCSRVNYAIKGKHKCMSCNHIIY